MKFIELVIAIYQEGSIKYVPPPLQVGISDWSKAGEDGTEEESPTFPYRLRFHPTGNISFPDDYQQPINADLMTIPSGSTLYQVRI